MKNKRFSGREREKYDPCLLQFSWIGKFFLLYQYLKEELGTIWNPALQLGLRDWEAWVLERKSCLLLRGSVILEIPGSQGYRGCHPSMDSEELTYVATHLSHQLRVVCPVFLLTKTHFLTQCCLLWFLNTLNISIWKIKLLLSGDQVYFCHCKSE